MSFSRLLRLYGNTGSVHKGRTIHGKLITSGFRPDIYTNNHLLSLYLKSDLIDDARQVFARMPERNHITWTTLISWYSQMGFVEEALDSLRLMISVGFDLNQYNYVSAVSASARIGNSRAGKEIHARIYRSGEELNSFVSNSLVNLYGKCGLLESAQCVFDAIPEPNSVSWHSLLSGYCQCGENVKGLKIFLRSLEAGVKISEFSCVTVLSACAALEKLELGMQMHSHAIKGGIRMDQFVVTGLTNFYVKCGELDLAHQVFCEVNEPHLTTWTALILGYVQQGKGREAIDLFLILHSSGFRPNEITFSSVLGAFADAMEVEVGKELHCLIIKSGFYSFTHVGNAVVNFYSKSGFLNESWKTFEDMEARDIVSWNALISGCVNCSHYGKAIELLNCMLCEGFEPNLYTYSSLLNICGDLPASEWGRQTHCRILKPGFDSAVVVGSALIDMYAKCGRLRDARKVFDNLHSKNLVSWNAMLVGYAQHGFGREALDIYDVMQKSRVKPNDITFIGVLSACGHAGLLEEGLQYFDSMKRDYGITPRRDHLACMVSLLARKGQTKRALDFIKHFPEVADKVVWRCLLSGCKTSKDLVLGQYAAEKILSIDPDDISALIMLSNIFAEEKMWNETAKMRRIMKEKALKKDPGYSWTELKNNVYSFSAGHNVDIHGCSVHKILNGLTAQLFDAGYVPAALLQFHRGKSVHQELLT